MYFPDLVAFSATINAKNCFSSYYFAYVVFTTLCEEKSEIGWFCLLSLLVFIRNEYVFFLLFLFAPLLCAVIHIEFTLAFANQSIDIWYHHFTLCSLFAEKCFFFSRFYLEKGILLFHRFILFNFLETYLFGIVILFFVLLCC